VYHYAGNNPVKLVDPNGRELTLNGDNENINTFINKLKNLSGYDLEIVDKKIIITGINDESKTNSIFGQVISNVINSEKNISLTIVNGNGIVFFDIFNSIGNSTLDLEDIDFANNAYPEIGVGDSIIGHVLNEQLYAVNNNARYEKAHKSGGNEFDKLFFGNDYKEYSGESFDQKYLFIRSSKGEFGFYQDGKNKNKVNIIPQNAPIRSIFK
jgi:hypothetical protein